MATMIVLTSRVYLLVRAKGDATPEQRVKKLLDTPLFHKLWARPGLLQKVIPSGAPSSMCRRSALCKQHLSLIQQHDAAAHLRHLAPRAASACQADAASPFAGDGILWQ